VWLVFRPHSTDLPLVVDSHVCVCVCDGLAPSHLLSSKDGSGCRGWGRRRCVGCSRHWKVPASRRLRRLFECTVRMHQWADSLLVCSHSLTRPPTPPTLSLHRAVTAGDQTTIPYVTLSLALSLSPRPFPLPSPWLSHGHTPPLPLPLYDARPGEVFWARCPGSGMGQSMGPLYHIASTTHTLAHLTRFCGFCRSRSDLRKRHGRKRAKMRTAMMMLR
jgi:hypothetical protein